MRRFKEEAKAFAISQGFDDVIEVDEPVDGCEGYVAGLRHDNCKNWKIQPLFDSTPHVIIADEHGARWRSKADAITVDFKLSDFGGLPYSKARALRRKQP